MASTLNAGGAMLWHSANGLSSSTLAGQFMEVFQDEADLMKPEKAIHCVLHEQDEFLKVQHHHKILGFRFSQYSCPRETELVVSLLQALLSEFNRTAPYVSLWLPVSNKVHILCLTISPF